VTTYYSCSLMLSQGLYDTRANAVLLVDDGVNATQLSIEWPVMPPQTDPENAGEWLFHILEDLVSGFDAHQVTNAKHEPTRTARGAHHA
jgi:hypothetical protein